MGTQALKERLSELAAELQRPELAPELRAELEREIEGLSAKHGDWILEALGDGLTGDMAYSQHEQDNATRSRYPKEVGQAGRLAVVSFTELGPDFDSADQTVLSFVYDLIPREFYSIPREVRMNGIERQAWYYYIQGYTPDVMYGLLSRRGRLFEIPEIERILLRAMRKAYKHPAMGWRTVMAEDIHRGKQGHPPIRAGRMDSIHATD